SPNYYLAKRNNLPVGVVYPDQDTDGLGTPVNPNVAAVINGAANPEAARKFIDFILSAEGQRILVTEDYEIPLVEKVPAGDALPLGLLLQLAATTLSLASLVTLWAMLLALPLAWLVVRTDLPFRNLCRWLAVIPLAIPSYIGAMTYIALLGPVGSVNTWVSAL